MSKKTLTIKKASQEQIDRLKALQVSDPALYATLTSMSSALAKKFKVKVVTNA